eukprot:1147649-Pelagomonas_calceolata.AAC.4
MSTPGRQNATNPKSLIEALGGGRSAGPRENVTARGLRNRGLEGEAEGEGRADEPMELLEEEEGSPQM